MSECVREHKADSGSVTAHQPMLFRLEKPDRSEDKVFAELIWVEQISSTALAEQERRTLRLLRGRLTVLATVKGSMQIQSDALTATIRRGQAMLLADGEDCCLTALDAGEYIVAVLSGSLVETVLKTHLAQKKVFCPAGLADLLEAANAVGREPISAEQISAAAYRLLMRLHETARLYEESSGYPLLVDAGMGIMRDEFAHICGVDEVAERLGISTAHFTRLFSRAVGTSPGRFLKLRKIEYAKKLLPLPDMTVSLVAEMIGFSDVNYFAKAFRKETGMSPGEFRKLNHSVASEDEEVQNMLREIYL
ncbi:helix-turn-helix transcriptional regulator [Candidatus Agathobaculum pullicola]|uniref:helix-turn-helix transcriptional regulator n=1 Tax=Candidatus Agathobaculum pullicola TaxID=2838426 RepID=UPI003F93879B